MNHGDKILVLGLGNEVLGDESLGLKIIDDLKQLCDTPGIYYSQTTRGGLEILDYLKGHHKLVIIDTISTGTGHPGNIYFYTIDNYRETLHLSSSHDTNFLTTIKTGEMLGLKMPEEIDILAIEIIPDLQLGEEFSNIIQKKYDRILHDIINFIKKKIELCTNQVHHLTGKQK